MYDAVKSYSFSGISVTTAAFNIPRGGNYGITVTAQWGGGSVGLQRLAADGSSYIDVIPQFTADGYATTNLVAGTYQIYVATATAVYIDVTSTVVAQ